MLVFHVQEATWAQGKLVYSCLSDKQTEECFWLHSETLQLFSFLATDKPALDRLHPTMQIKSSRQEDMSELRSFLPLTMFLPCVHKSRDQVGAQAYSCSQQHHFAVFKRRPFACCFHTPRRHPVEEEEEEATSTQHPDSN